MNWHKIIFSGEQIIHYEVVNFRRKIQDIFFAAQAPEDFCVFSEMSADENDRTISILYFSPVAYQYCQEIVDAYSGKKCDKPNLNEDFSPVAGDPRCNSRVRQMT